MTTTRECHVSLGQTDESRESFKERTNGQQQSSMQSKETNHDHRNDLD